MSCVLSLASLGIRYLGSTSGSTDAKVAPTTFCCWNELLNVALFSQSVSPMAARLPVAVVASLWSSDLISQQQLAADSSLSPETLLLVSRFLSSVWQAPFPAPSLLVLGMGGVGWRWPWAFLPCSALYPADLI